jgi:hypothetical protein
MKLSKQASDIISAIQNTKPVGKMPDRMAICGKDGRWRIHQVGRKPILI